MYIQSNFLLCSLIIKTTLPGTFNIYFVPADITLQDRGSYFIGQVEGYKGFLDGIRVPSYPFSIAIHDHFDRTIRGKAEIIFQALTYSVSDESEVQIKKSDTIIKDTIVFGE